MSKALTSLQRSQPLKPELRLAQAISEFEADLPEEDKARFKAQRQQRPELVDVMRLTAEIDRSTSAKGKGRVFGPRWTSFLDGVQRFASIGDILIGGSQYLPACAAIARSSSYIDKLSEFFMQIGRTTPRYQNMALLFPGSKELQTSYTEYYIVVVHLCHHVFKTFNTPKFKLLLNSHQDVLGSFETELRNWSDAIRDEMSIQAVVLAKLEQQESAQSRSVARKDRYALEVWRKEKRWLQLLDACSGYDHQTTWKQIRKSRSSMIHLNDRKYQDWKSATKSSTLVYSGKLGAGKSVLMTNIVDDLFLDTQSNPYHVAYFFCRHDISESLRARIIIGSLTRQLLVAFGLDQALDVHPIPNSGPFDIDQLSQIVIGVVTGCPRLVYLVVDGLNDCEQNERDAVLKVIGQWQAKTRILLCISSRLEPDAQTKLRSAQLVCPVYSSMPDPHPELEAYIDLEIEQCIDSGKLVLGDSDIVSTIKEVLRLRSQGMFLWASLLIKWICDLTTDQDILQALEDSPTSLFDIYQSLLERHHITHKRQQEAIFQLISVAYRPLSISELREALSVEPGETDWNNSKLPNDMPGLLICCGGLVIIEEEELSVRFVHESARQFLLQGDGPHHFAITTAGKSMAQIITTYLNYSVFENQISTTVLQTLPGDRIVDSALATVSNSAPRLLKNLSRFIRSSETEAPDISRLLAATAMKTRRHKILDLSLESYARRYWFLHSACFLDEDGSLVQVLARRLVQKHLEISTADLAAPLSWTISNGYLAAFELLLNNAETSTQEDVQEGLLTAARAGHRGMIERYLQAPDNFYVTNQSQLWCDLVIVAAARNWRGILRMFLKQDTARKSIYNAVKESQEHAAGDCIRFPQGYVPACDLLLRAASKEWSTILRLWNTGQVLADNAANKHEELADACLDIMLSADCLSKHNICGLRAPAALRLNIDKMLLGYCIPSEVQYACLYWPRHIEQSNGELSRFESRIIRVLQQRLLVWFEAASLLGRAREMPTMITLLHELFSGNLGSDSEIMLYLYHAEAFARMYRDVADSSPLQIYLSGSIFAPHAFKDIIDVGTPVGSIRFSEMLLGWHQNKQISRNHPDWIMLVEFSPDGKQLAVASAIKMKIYDTATGALQLTIDGDWRRLITIAFSSNGKQLAAVKSGYTIEVWDLSVGRLQCSLKEHSGRVILEALSPDGKQFATASYDGKMRIYDLTSGSVHRTLKADSGLITFIGFSPDGKQLASGSENGSIIIWNTASGGRDLLTNVSHPVYRIVFHPSLPTLEPDQDFLKLYDAVYISYSAVKQANLTLTGGWLSFNDKKLIWVPQEYRGCFALNNQSVAIGLNTRGVLLLDISFDELNRQFALEPPILTKSIQAQGN